jgi:hypothetical protein
VAWVNLREASAILREHHYLGPISRGAAWRDCFGVIVIASPTSRRIPLNWLELVRWCITSTEKNSGSKQWSVFVRALRLQRPDITTIVSYSDPSVGHDGALYRACNWWWAPTWHRLRPPPTGNGNWESGGAMQAVKDRWIFALRPDRSRVGFLMLKDEAILRKSDWARYREPGGALFKEFRVSNLRASDDLARTP